MSETIQLEVTNYTEELLNIGIKELYIPAFNGQVGILSDHKPYISLLKAGVMFYTDVFGRRFYFYIRGGIIEVNDNNVSLISDSLEKIEAANKKEIENKLVELDKKIKSLGKIEPGMSQDEIKKLPDELAKTLEEQKEFDIKMKTIQDIEAKGKPLIVEGVKG